MPKATNIAIGLICLAISIAFYALSFSQAPGISDWSLSPAFFPRLSAFIMGGLSLLLVLHNIFPSESLRAQEKTPGRRAGTRLVLVTAAMMAAYIYLIELIGFIPSSALTLAGMMYYFGVRNWLLLGLVAAVVPLSLHLIFWKAMYVMFPSGVLFR